LNYFLLAASVAVLCIALFVWTAGLRDLIRSPLKVPDINPGSPIDSTGGLPFLPSISVIVPAHNEQTTIRQCLQSVFDQDYPNYEIIMVDDRSADLTASIAEELARGQSNLRIITVRELPEGWTGKCHALDVGVGYASGQWLAFLDADSSLHETALLQCYRAALQYKVNMVTLSPKFIVKTFWEKALQPAFVVASSILFPLAKVNDPSSPVATANGMFYLISRDAYDKIGGHRDVKDLAVEDIGIGKRVKALGLGLLFANGRHVLQTRMFTGFQSTLNGWTRILSGSMNYELPTVVRYLAVHILMSPFAAFFALYTFVPMARELYPNTWFVLPLIFLLEIIVVPPWFCSRLGIAKRYSVLMCLGNCFLIWSFLIIIKRILMKDVLQWRGTTYQSHSYRPKALTPEPQSRETGSLTK
jgi:cellulose synthase/poly-beta-1,6-N-acetylglucosamine synthase-like glycosyltransferase